MTETLKTILIWLMIGAAILWICTSLALIESMVKDKERRRKQRRSRR